MNNKIIPIPSAHLVKNKFRIISIEHRTVQEGGGAETTAFGGRGGKDDDLNGI